jgi:hypothetical protein
MLKMENYQTTRSHIPLRYSLHSEIMYIPQSSKGLFDIRVRLGVIDIVPCFAQENPVCFRDLMISTCRVLFVNKHMPVTDRFSNIPGDRIT